MHVNNFAPHRAKLPHFHQSLPQVPASVKPKKTNPHPKIRISPQAKSVVFPLPDMPKLE